VSDKNEVQAFKINVTDEPHFTIIKNDTRSRIQDSSISSEALLPDGPYDLWRQGETSRRVKDLSGSFAQLPHLPKMLKAQAIIDTLVEGCQMGAFVLRLTRPDGSSRTWWYSRPDETAMNDPSLELILSEAAELKEIASSLLEPERLPELWKSDPISVQAVIDYFNGTVVQVQRDGYREPLPIPKASKEAVKASVKQAVESGALWLTNGPASILAEPIPAGVLTEHALIQRPPVQIMAAEILPETLPHAWAKEQATALSIATALSQKFGQTLPWKTVSDVVSASINARFTQLDPKSGKWPCEYPSAQGIKLKVSAVSDSGGGYKDFGSDLRGANTNSNILVARSELKADQIQDLGDIIPKLLEIKNKANIPMAFQVQIELGDGETQPDDETIKSINRILGDISDRFQFVK
jgi:DNA-directed RNA polymerase subunit H (RpoH/RPB5)